jgi:hypothetical protein
MSDFVGYDATQNDRDLKLGAVIPCEMHRIVVVDAGENRFQSRKDESPCDARPRPFRAGRWPAPSGRRSRCGTARPIIGGPLESILGDFLRIAL